MSRRQAHEMVVAPRGETEHRVAALWTDLLGIQPASIDDDFQTAGGDTARAGELLDHVARQWRVHVTLDEFLSSSSIAGLAATIERKVAEARTYENHLLNDALSELESLRGRLPSFD